MKIMQEIEINLKNFKNKFGFLKDCSYIHGIEIKNKGYDKQ